MIDISKFELTITLAMSLIIMSTYGQGLEKNGMTVNWHFESDEWIEFTITAPLKGWVGIGFNEKDELVGSNLIMITDKKGKGHIEDQFVTGLGKHPKVTELGIDHVELVSTEEMSSGTQVVFRIRSKPLDGYHYTLNKGGEIHLVMAYSESDDFTHHSRMRTSATINL